MNQRIPLSARVRPGSEAAPWVIEEIKKMEAALAQRVATDCHKRANDYCTCQRNAMLCDGTGPQPAAATEPDMRAVVAVAVTMLFDTHPADVKREFTTEELTDIVDTTKPHMEAGEQVETIYARAWRHIAASPQPQPVRSERHSYVPVDSNMRDGNGNHPNDKEPRTAACIQALNARGDSDGQGLDGFWKWGFAAGFNAALAAPQPQPVQGPVAWQSIESMAAERYKVVPSHESMFYRYAVVAGNGTQQLYLGRETECENMARKFAGAFLDGAHVMRAFDSRTPSLAQRKRPRN